VSAEEQQPSGRTHGEVMSSLRMSRLSTPSDGRWIPAIDEPTMKCWIICEWRNEDELRMNGCSAAATSTNLPLRLGVAVKECDVYYRILVKTRYTE
jgi:hypothetical protein